MKRLSSNKSFSKLTAWAAVICLVWALFPVTLLVLPAVAEQGGVQAITVPWKDGQPHPTYTGKEVSLKAVMRDGTWGSVYSWDFGDGTVSETMTPDWSTNYQLSVKHAYTGAPGTIYTAIVTVVDPNGNMAFDTYEVIVKEKTLEVEADITIDEALWYLHRRQDRYELDGRNFGGWGNWAHLFQKNITGVAVEAFEVQGHLPNGDPDEDPYVDSVRRGLNFLLVDLATMPISMQVAGDPDTNNNGTGIAYDRDLWAFGQIYNQPAAMMALGAGSDRDMIADIGSPDVDGKSYAEITNDLVDYLSWAQNDAVPANGIHVYDLSTGIDTVVAEGDDKSRPDISGHNVVWEDYRNSNADIYLYDLDTNTEIPIVTDPSWQMEPAISGNRVVWTDSRNGSPDIYMYDISSGLERKVATSTAPKYMPKIDGDKVVWMDLRNGDPDIYMYDLATETEVPIAVGDDLQMEPAVSGDKVVWFNVDMVTGMTEIFMYDLSAGVETQITSNGSSKFSPSISGDQIIWTDLRNGNADIYGYDISTGTEIAINTAPENHEALDIDGERFVYLEYGSAPPWGSDIHVYDMSSGTQTEIEAGESIQWEPAISGDLVVWTSFATANSNKRGGWGLDATDLRGETRHVRWAVLGFNAAEENLGIAAPAWVGTELEYWLNYAQNRVLDGNGLPTVDYGGFGVRSPTHFVDSATTADGIIGLNYVGIANDDQRMVDALGYLDRNWERTIDDSGSRGNFGYYYAMYGIARAMNTANPPITMVGDHDWYAEYARYLVDNQLDIGTWSYRGLWDPASMAVLILTRETENAPPVLAIDDAAITVSEGEEAVNMGTITDPDSDSATLSASIGTIVDNGNGTWSWSYDTVDGPDETQVVTVSAEDDQGALAEATFELSVDNVSPQIESITVPINPVAVNSAVNVSADFSDPGTLDTHTALWDWGDTATTPGVVDEVNGSGSVVGSHTYTTPGVYTVEVTATDKDYALNSLSSEQYIVVYDPEGGFVTGGGWINSPLGAYSADLTLTGKANFGFVSKYKNGASVPSGETEFQFKAGDLNFHSTSYEWLVVAGTKAKFKGDGTINSAGSYGFMLSAIDGKDDNDTDKFRIQIWDKDSGSKIYDNKIGADETSDPDTELGGGNIVVHKD